MRLLIAMAIGLVLAIVALAVVPVLARERADDWRAYAEAAAALKSGGPLYPWTDYPDIRAFGQHPYLYPPPLAAIWSIGLTAESFAVAKIVCLAAAMAWLSRRSGSSWPIAAAVAVAAVTSSPAVHDAMLGNVMMLVAAGVALSLASPGWPGSGTLGVMSAIALKPAIGPYLLWLLLRRRSAFGRTFVAGLATTVVFVLLLGPGRYVEYLQALPKTAVLAAPFTGNLGLSAISPLAGLIGIAVAYAWTLAAAIRLDERAAAVVALAMTQLAQPTIGLNYGVLVIPGLIVLWTVDRRAAVAMAITLPIVVIVSPVLAAILLAGTASVASMVASGERAGALAHP
jgi:hypothetical protein